MEPEHVAAQHRKKEPLKVILDSNAFFAFLEFKMDIFEEIKCLLNRNVEFILLSPIKRELETLALSEEPKMRRQAAFALHLAKKCTPVTIEAREGEFVDDVILRVSKSWGSPVVTNDRVLRRRLRNISVPVIYLRQKSRLDIDGLIS